MHPALLLPPLVACLLLLQDHANADCEPATCGNLTLRYPFWLGSSTQTSSSSCGHPAFEVWCLNNGSNSAGAASLKGSSLHVLSIDYANSSFVASHTRVAGDDGVCRTDFNMSVSIALSPFTISRRNRALCFLYNCSGGVAPSGSDEYVNATGNCPAGPIYAYLAGAYYWEKPPAIETDGCTYTYIPVLGKAAAGMTTAANYSRLLEAGFLLEWEAAGVGDCAACNDTGGQCRYDGDKAAFWCLCPGGGRRAAGSTCADPQLLSVSRQRLIAKTLSPDGYFNTSGSRGCQIPTANASSELGPGPPFSISPANQNLIFYNCTKPVSPDRGLVETTCRNNTYVRVAAGNSDELTGNYFLDGCFATVVPVRGRSTKINASNYEELVRKGFLVTWQWLPLPSGKMTTGKISGIVCGTVGGLLACVLFVVWFKRTRRKQVGAPNGFTCSESSMQSYSKDLELGGSPHIFTYEELEEATDGFSDSKELGDGGFGTVYKGTLRDGRVVAVKRLYKNNYKRVEQFINEVDILSRLLHQNLVTLYGCTSRSSRDLMLVYEYIPNGTVADHLHGSRASERGLTWPVRMNIAIETAGALSYLHAVEIIHRDVKTNNILLDNSFHVKVADFGLSRLYPLEVTHVSTVPQGTPGYVDPVYHQCYKLTDKSDVYSFGVVLVELISSKPAVDMSRSHSEINLANMALNRIQNHEVEQLVDPELGYGTDEETKRMIDLVAELAFQCLQLERDSRPSIKEVVEALNCIKNGDSPGKRVDMSSPPKEDAHLLRNSIQYSPDSVIHRFHSQSTTHSVASNASG